MLPTITVDVGTTSVKLCMFDAGGSLRASARISTPTQTDAWGDVYDMDALTAAIEGFIRGLDPKHRAVAQRIAITGVGESGGLVRSDLSLASPMILWHDHRGADYLAHLTAIERQEIYQVTGLPVNANYGLSKVAWAVANADAAEGAQWLNIAEYLAARMTGRRWSEYSLASRTMALDLDGRAWSPEICALVGLDVDVFPPLRTAVDGFAITAEFAREVGLPRDLQVHVAGHDHMVGAVGAELSRGELLNSTGTTEGLLFLRDMPSVDEHSEGSKLSNGISCAGSDFTLFASIPTGGSAFATLQSMLGITASQLSDCISLLHERYLAGAVDLRDIPLVLPQFRGSPPPTKRASARGVIANLRPDTTCEDIVFGCFLGLALQFEDVFELFRTRPDRLKVIGPASANPLWLQLKADLLGIPLSASRFPEVVSRGAQSLASGEQGDWDSCEPADVLVDPGRHAMLSEWRDDIRPQWEYLKDVPA
ncbi:FGGY-family carbohydrate kinase [Micromonospora sp. DT81.3]|uniref:FGGY-family carbohydrate kinase n=1 Tax=Micromonospora sp. DT81.3 TaxID=3416523 RepID=UPI003CE800DF